MSIKYATDDSVPLGEDTHPSGLNDSLTHNVGKTAFTVGGTSYGTQCTAAVYAIERAGYGITQRYPNAKTDP
ncbi:MAG: hypothetical protein LBJ43_06600 [Propionibacteriaceae bacterium]|nr:hypothetical protein [Propionibacteriaceae bacterium]